MIRNAALYCKSALYNLTHRLIGDTYVAITHHFEIRPHIDYPKISFVLWWCMCYITVEKKKLKRFWYFVYYMGIKHTNRIPFNNPLYDSWKESNIHFMIFELRKCLLNRSLHACRTVIKSNHASCSSYIVISKYCIIINNYHYSISKLL
jgi:hypothetical protein